MSKRPVDPDFIMAMNEKLEHGRLCGRDDYDEGWPLHPYPGFLFDRLIEEVGELMRAVLTGTVQEIRHEAADVANFAMFIADAHGTLSIRKRGPNEN